MKMQRDYIHYNQEQDKSIQYSTEDLAGTIWQQKGIKLIQIRKEKAKFSLLANDTVVYIGEHKNSTREHLQLVNTFSNVAGTKID